MANGVISWTLKEDFIMSKTEINEENLKRLRGHLSYKSGVKPYVIFPDSIVDTLLDKQPKSIAALSQIKGFPSGGERISKWGEPICNFFKGDLTVSSLSLF